MLVLAVWGALSFTGDKGGSHRLAHGNGELDGKIAADTDANAEMLTPVTKRFRDADTAGVILRFNSPGGSPVQAGIIIRRDPALRAKHPTSRFTPWSMKCAPRAAITSPSAADKIYVDKASIVGSIGVLMDGFGFTGLMDKLGIERRLLPPAKTRAFMIRSRPETPKKEKCTRCSRRSISSSSTWCGKAAASA